MVTESAGESTEAKGTQWVRIVLEYVIPAFLIVFGITILVFVFWLGPTAVIKSIVSFMPENPGPKHALIMGSATVVCIVFFLPFWPPLMIAIAMVFGFWRGFFIDYCAMVVAAVISFALARFVCMRSVRQFLEESEYKHVGRMMRMVEKDGNSLKFLFLFRFLFSPIWVRNYIPGLLDVSFLLFLLTVCVHAIWICAVFASVGAAATDLAEALDGKKDSRMSNHQIAIFGISLLALILMTWWAFSEYQQLLAEEDEEEPLLPSGDVT